ncbi:hypothetical protein PENPOL_c010G04178 [Penicillium polonicum]|uniref:Uncharacterized protein n=1 Tax=Penicillium polonicum TaxID=60169 RepID=A0A1V6NEN9_PENPO|nr:hypothetical protein PENPOL_c010G04178 [Penicillium polonicum]
MHLFMPITFLLVTTFAPTFAAGSNLDPDPSRLCIGDEKCRYTTDYPMDDFKPPENECTCPGGSECTHSGDDTWNKHIHYSTCQ